MGDSHKFRNILITAGLSGSALAAYNYITSRKADQSKYLADHISSSQFNWKLGNIYYTKQGTGTPILLVHDYLSPAGCWEWKILGQKLAAEHTVYALDLPGCGRSDKSFSAYTNYLYVQLLSDFISKIIKEPVTLITSGHSIQAAVMLAKSESALFTQIIAINPPAPQQPSICDLLLGKLIPLPLIGTFTYNLLTSPCRLENHLEQLHMFRDRNLQSAYVKACCQGAHMEHSNRKYLFSSYLRGYMNSNLTLSLKDLTVPFTILSGTDVMDSEKAILTYRKQNPQISVQQIKNGRLMMQMEQADEIARYINNSR